MFPDIANSPLASAYGAVLPLLNISSTKGGMTSALLATSNLHRDAEYFDHAHNLTQQWMALFVLFCLWVGFFIVQHVFEAMEEGYLGERAADIAETLEGSVGSTAESTAGLSVPTAERVTPPTTPGRSLGGEGAAGQGEGVTVGPVKLGWPGRGPEYVTKSWWRQNLVRRLSLSHRALRTTFLLLFAAQCILSFPLTQLCHVHELPVPPGVVPPGMGKVCSECWTNASSDVTSVLSWVFVGVGGLWGLVELLVTEDPNTLDMTRAVLTTVSVADLTALGITAFMRWAHVAQVNKRIGEGCLTGGM